MDLKNALASPFNWLGTKATSAVEMIANSLPFVPNWLRVFFVPPTFNRMAREGYKASSVVYAIITKYALSFIEPPIRAYAATDDTPVPIHPMLSMLRRPNKWMDEARLMSVIIIYMLIGGDCFLHKLRNKAGNVIGLWPLHAGQMVAVPTPDAYISHYRFTVGDNKFQDVDQNDVIHIQWPSVDPDNICSAFPPLLALAREVDTTAEVARYTYALFKNDATPRTVFTLPAGSTPPSDKLLEQFKSRAEERYGGDNRGSLAIMTGGGTVTRLGLNLKELDLSSALDAPEAHIAAAFLIPAIVAGLGVGLKRSTFANYSEARASWYEETLTPLWRLVGSAINNGLQGEYSGPVVFFRHDLANVIALKENADLVHKQVNLTWTNSGITRNELRSTLGYDVLPEELGNLFFNDLLPPAIEQPAPLTITPNNEVTTEPVPTPPDEPDNEDDAPGILAV